MKSSRNAASAGPRTVRVTITVDEDGTPRVDVDPVRLRPGDTLRFQRQKKDWDVSVELDGKASPFRHGQRRFTPSKGSAEVRPGAPSERFKYDVTVAGVTLDPDIVIEPPDDGGGGG